MSSEAANVKREGGINSLDQLLEQVGPGLALVNGYLRIEESKSSTWAREEVEVELWVGWRWIEVVRSFGGHPVSGLKVLSYDSS